MHYDPAYAYEIAHIMQDGLHRMYGEGKTPEERTSSTTSRSTTSRSLQPKEPERRRRRGHPARASTSRRGHTEGLPDDAPRAQILGSGVGVPWALEAQQLLADDWGVAADVWSVTSWNELRRDGLRRDEQEFLSTRSDPPMPWVTQLPEAPRARSSPCRDYMRAVQDQIREWVPGTSPRSAPTASASPTPARAARRFFHIDGPSVAVRTLQLLAEDGKVDADVPRRGRRDVPPRRRHGRHVGQRGRRELTSRCIVHTQVRPRGPRVHQAP